jgi:predicted TIM-barrel fold metal-dependent hydrolase
MTPLLTDIDILDGHVHPYQRDQLDQLIADIRYTGARQFCMLITDRMEGVGSDEQWDNAVLLKRTYPSDAFLLGGLDISAIVEHGRSEPDIPFAQQLLDLMAAGCDGLKLLIGKPDRRKALRFPLDSPILQPMLSLAEESRFPVLWHVGDPPEFWSEHTVPLWARQRGWWYDDTHPPKAQIDAEIARVFERHPTLNLILPHFFFLSDRLDDAAALLDRYPSYALDLAPGVEMYHNLTARHADARAFFIRYADRILFGTDFGLPCGWHRDRGMMIRRFLETEDVFDVPVDPAMQPDDRPSIRGLALPRDVLQKIYATNFRRRVGATPRPLMANAEHESTNRHECTRIGNAI